MSYGSIGPIGGLLSADGKDNVINRWLVAGSREFSTISLAIVLIYLFGVYPNGSSYYYLTGSTPFAASHEPPTNLLWKALMA